MRTTGMAAVSATPGRASALAAIAAIVALVVAAPALAQVPLCVEVRAPEAEAAGIRKLVLSELARHPSHPVVESGCTSRLLVEVFEAAGTRYLTARIGEEVPVRYAVKDDRDVETRLVEALSLVLHNDPVYLSEDITHYSEWQRLLHSVGKRGRNAYRFEVFEAMSRDGNGPVFVPGGAFSVTRGSGSWQVMARVYAGGLPAGTEGDRRKLRAIAGADAGITYEFLEKASWSPYLAAAAGVQYMRFEGMVPDGAGGRARDSIDEIGAVVSGRAGVRFLRWHDFDIDLWVAGYLPLFNTNDPDSTLFGSSGLYTPSMQAGIGVGF
jgi:hypothetical protein